MYQMNRLCARMHAQSAQNTGYMTFHRTDGGADGFADFLIRATFGNQIQNFLLTRGQLRTAAFARTIRTRTFTLGGWAHCCGQQFRRDIHTTRQNQTHGRDQHLGFGIFNDKTGNILTISRLNQMNIIRTRQNRQRHARKTLTHTIKCRQALRIRQSQIQQNQIQIILMTIDDFQSTF